LRKTKRRNGQHQRQGSAQQRVDCDLDHDAPPDVGLGFEAGRSA
jgi:hypothetical protein